MTGQLYVMGKVLTSLIYVTYHHQAIQRLLLPLAIVMNAWQHVMHNS